MTDYQVEKKHSLKLNALSNFSRIIIGVAINFLLTPFLIHHLGKARYGMWVLVYSFPLYYGLVRLGIGAGLMRYVPLYLGRDDNASVNRIVNSGLATSLLMGVLIFTASWIIAEPLAAFFKVGNEFVILVRVFGLAGAIECPAFIFDAGLKAQEKWVMALTRCQAVNPNIRMDILRPEDWENFEKRVN